MNTQTRTRIARTVAIAAAASITTVTTTIVAPSTTASAHAQERPCFIVQPRWSTAIDGPAPTCAIPSWQGTEDRDTAAEVATIADCIDPAHRPVVTTCPYPVKSGDRFSSYWPRSTYADEYDGPGR